VHLLECGLLRGSFIPPADIKAARDVLRYRTKVVQSRTSELQRLGNVLQDAGIKIDSVASSIATKSGLAMTGALTGGERRPKVLSRRRIRYSRRIDTADHHARGPGCSRIPRSQPLADFWTPHRPTGR
jgi:hypothetical protein